MSRLDLHSWEKTHIKKMRADRIWIGSQGEADLRRGDGSNISSRPVVSDTLDCHAVSEMFSLPCLRFPLIH
jgi:hypothetical protein